MPDHPFTAERLKATFPVAVLLSLLLAACNRAPLHQDSQAASEAPRQSITFAFSGDLAGQNVCRDLTLGFPIFRHILETEPDFFIGLGDMIYADTPCEATGHYGNPQVPLAAPIARTADDFRAHWQYVRDDATFSKLLRDTAYYAVWDDHEVRNDFGSLDDLAPDSTDLHLLPAGREVFSEFNKTGSDKLYFKRSFGTQLEIFFLDTRGYRDLNSAMDNPAHPKTMLGDEQRRWLLEGVRASDARWKIIVSSVPLSIPTGWPAEKGRDGWANFDQDTGFELELIAILRQFADSAVTNLLFLSADVHFATGIRYAPFADRPDFSFHEFVTGPLQAGLFPNKALDETLKPERLFYHAPPSAEAVTSFAEARRWFNYGVIRIDPYDRLQFVLADGFGEVRQTLLLQPDGMQAQPPTLP